MPTCQVSWCSNVSGRSKKSTFRFPDPKKCLDNKRICQKWIRYAQNPNIEIKTFQANPKYVICEDHFTRDSFTGPYVNSAAKSMNFVGKKFLKKGAFPTVGRDDKDGDPDDKQRLSAESIAEKKLKAKLKDEIRHMRASHAARAACSPVIVEQSAGDILSIPPSSTTIDEAQHIHIESSSQMSVMETDDLVNVPDGVQVNVAGTPVVQQKLYQSDVLVATKVIQHQKMVHEEMMDEGEDVPGINVCGHPCVLCYPNRLSVTSGRGDHTYAAPVQYVSVETQTDPCVTDDAEKGPSPLFSTPKKTVNLPEENLSMDISDFSVESSFREDFCDLTFTSEMTDIPSDNESVTPEYNTVADRKFLVFESSLEKLINYISCPTCRAPVCTDDTMKDTTEGSLLKCDLYCIEGHHICKWHSQPLIGKMPAGNLLVSASILFSGLSFTRIHQMASFLGLQLFGQTTFTSIQRNQLMPVVLHSWEAMQDTVLEKVRATGKALRLAGDGRCDSPGFSAKYCTYSLMELDTNEIVTFVVVSVEETGSSSKMEVLGFRRCLELLMDKGFRIEVLATDRHVQIRSLLNKELQFQGINHQFDVWHLVKSVKKKLTAKAKLRGAEELGEWIKAVTNHLWWCASHCEENPDWLDECWLSVIHHVTNTHEFEGDLVKSCQHEPLDPAVARLKKWLKPGSLAHNGLKEVVMDKRLRKDIRQLSAFCHTGNLEVFHSLMTKYVPKRQEFDHDQMLTRTALAAMDHNMSQNRLQKTNQQGDRMFRAVCPKATGNWVVKKVFEDKDYSWVNDLLTMVVKQKETKFLPPTTLKKRKNIAPRPAPKKADLVTNLKSRFL